ncbi:diguanylate cyclase (GGDEF) domain-containing protein [Rhizobiales bacterium GAS113]|nr:diguanylate cyclase (GGDEF) domain-containing protein [Rhizobiales bacterium GAS113]
MRLVAVVLATGVLGFGIIGGLTALRLHQQLNSQADALGHLSEQQLAHRLDGEAQLARARIEALGADAADRLRQLAQRADVARAVASRNDVTIMESLTPVAKTSGFERLIALDETGRVIGANAQLELLPINTALQGSDIAAKLKPLFGDNNRLHPQGYEDTRELAFDFMSPLKLPLRPTIAHIAVEPVFDEFGDLVGALFAIRPIGQTERTLENFTSLANAGVAILQDNRVVSAAGPQGVTFTRLETKVGSLQHSDDGNYVARCVDYEAAIRVCVFTDAAIISTTRDQMFQIGAAQTRALMGQFLASAALALGALVAALLLVVRHTTKGLSTLASAAKEIAGGNLDVPFRAMGVGEVRSLGMAFERMLANLRASTGKIRQLAFYDAISQLPNREKIRDDAPGVISATGHGALFFLDLDGFKSINDTFGHKAGDALLRKVALRLTELLGAMDNSIGRPLLARIGGDEFAAILPGISSMEAAREVARGMIATLRAPFNLGGDHASVGASIGIAMYPADGTTYEDLLVNADLAMYAAKSSGRNTYAFFVAELAEKARERQALEYDLTLAIRNEELSVEYQPKVSCADGRIRGVEALVRWVHPTLGNISPEHFVRIAEEIGLIGDIDRFVLKRALGDIGDLIRGGSDIVLAVNVTATEIEDPLFIKHVVKAVRKAHFPPSRLELEITESVAMRNPKLVCERITLLRQLGIRFALDDFGAGYSNLATMARLPFDSVKLDRSLVSGVAADPEKQSIVRIAIRLASELGFETVAEGVETAEDLHFVAENGATTVQGYVFSRPLPLAEFSALLQPSRLLSPLSSSSNQHVFKARKRAS